MDRKGRRGGRLICMIAYTNYFFDARVRREAETLVMHGFRVLCLTTKNDDPRATFFLDGVEVRELAVPKYRGKRTLAYFGSYLIFLLFASVACLRLLVARRLEAVHVHNLPDFLVLAALVPRVGGVKVVLDVHDSVPETYAAKFPGARVFWKALCAEERMSALVAHRVVCVNHPQRDVIVARGIPREKTFISMNVPDPRIFGSCATRGPTGPNGERFDVVYHGTMVERLGVDLIIRAAAELRDEIPVMRLHLWGQGDDLPEFQRLARDLSLEDRVSFTPSGFPLQELPRRLGVMSLGVVGNRRSVASELMLPVKLLEYVSLGIPAVAPRLRTIQHYFSDDMLTYYEPESVGSFAEAISHLYQKPEAARRQAERARTFLTEHGWERQGAELVSFYRDLLES